MTYSEPMEGYGIVKFSVRQGGSLVVGWLLDPSGEELGIRAETQLRQSETTEAAKDRIRERLRAKFLARTVPLSDPGDGFYTRAWEELRRQWPDEGKLMHRLNIERWSESTLRASVSYLKYQILPRLDKLGRSPTSGEIAKLQEELVEQASNSKLSLGVSERARFNLIGKLRRCDTLYRQMQELLRSWLLPDLDLRMEGCRVPDVEKCKSLPAAVRIRFAALLSILIPTPWGGAALCLGFMLLCGLRTAESAALFFRDITEEAGIQLIWVLRQRNGQEVQRILKTENAYRRLPLVRLLSHWVEKRRTWLLEQGYSGEQISDMPLNGHPKDPERAVDSGAVSAIGRRLLQLCGCDGDYWNDVRTLMADAPDTSVDGGRMNDVTAYVLRRDFASRASNVCAVSKQELDIALGHRVQLPAYEKRAFHGIESMCTFRQKLERYVFDPGYSDHPAFSPVTVEAGTVGRLPAYGTVRLTVPEDMEIHLHTEALDAWQPVALSVSNGCVERFTALSRPDLPEERRVRPLPGSAAKRAYYTELIDGVRGDQSFCRKAIKICEEVLT